MVTFKNGPAEGMALSLERAPYYLRVVIDPAGKVDALNFLEDKAEPNERIFAYYMIANHGSAHYCGRDKNGKRFGRWTRIADYRMVAEQPSDETLRDNAKWQAWAKATYDAKQREAIEEAKATDAAD